MKKHYYILASITVAVMILLCSCAINPPSNSIEEPSQTEEDEFMKIANEKTLLSDFFFENRPLFEEIVSGLSVHKAPNEKMVYCQYDDEDGLFWSDGTVKEPIDDQVLHNECKKLLALGNRITTIAYGVQSGDSGNYYAFGKTVYDRTGWPLCYIAILHLDTAEVNPVDYDELEQLESKWWISVVYYDGPCIQTAE